MQNKEHCWNDRGPRSPRYRAQDGWLYFEGGTALPKFIQIEDHMSQPCGQRKGMNPPGCEGCSELGEPK